MSNNQNNPETIPYQTFLKRLVILLTSVMILGFLFLISVIGYTAFNIRKGNDAKENSVKHDILLPLKGEIKSISLNGDKLLILLKTKQNISKALQISLSTGSIEKEINLYLKE